MARGKSAALAAVLALCVGVVTLLAAPASSADPTGDPNSLPIIQIHGFDSQDCPGSDASYGWTPFDYVLHRAGWTGPLLPVSFYVCDSNGADITGYGPDTPAVASPDVTADAPRAGYRQDAPITTLAHDLAWYVYRNFTVHDQAVDMVSLSMGGLIARTALYRVQAGDPTFPPALRVAQSITFSTPHHGVGTMASNGDDPGCHHMVQCMEWGSDSPLMTELMRDGTDPQGVGGTRWTVIGSTAGCDFLPIESAQGLPHALQVDLTKPCYSHIGYFWDIEPADDATAVVRDGDAGQPTTITDAPHSLTLATILLQNPPAAAPQPAPTTTQPTPAPTASGPTPAPTASGPTPTPTTSDPTPTPTTSAPTPTPSQPTPVAHAAPPVVVLTPLPAVSTSSTVTVRFRALDGQPARFDLRYRTARGTAPAGSWIEPAPLRDLPAGSRLLRPPPGTTQLCISVRARRDDAVSAWSVASCTALPVDDRALTRIGRWRQVAAQASFAGTLIRSGRAGDRASVTVRGRDVVLVLRTCPGCGAVRVLANGKPWRTVATRATTSRMLIVRLPAWATDRTVRLTLQAATARPVYVDGVASVR